MTEAKESGIGNELAEAPKKSHLDKRNGVPSRYFVLDDRNEDQETVGKAEKHGHLCMQTLMVPSSDLGNTAY
jgi:hypothetical protein